MALLFYLITVPLAAALRPAYQTGKLVSPWQSLWSIPLVYNREEGNAGSSWPCAGVRVAVKCILDKENCVKCILVTPCPAWTETTKVFMEVLAEKPPWRLWLFMTVC